MKKEEKTQSTYVTIETLKNMFDTIQTEYQKKFVEMYDFVLKSSYWIGTVLFASDYYFDFYDVKYAVDNDINFEFLNKWYDYSFTVYENFHEKVNLDEYRNGIIPYKEEDIESLQKLQKEKNHIEAEIDDLINNMKTTD